nr:putative ribonuclease H-like domain-containing protein [Tanacetum cinerariifolium]
MKTESTSMEPNKALIKDAEAEDVDVHLYRSMIGSLMYLTAFRPDIMFVVCACVRFQVTPKTSHLHAMKRIFRYLKGQPKLGLWYPRDSPFDLEAFSNSDYAGASLDKKSTTGGCQFLGKRLISSQCKKETIVANSTTKAEYVAVANSYRQVLWIQNQLLDYGFNFMNTKIYIDNESTICIMKNPVLHSKTKHIEIRHHIIRDSYEKKLIHATAKSKTVNDVKQIHAKVDGKIVVISESSVRSDLQFNDEDGTPLFNTMLVRQVVKGKGSGQPSEPQPLSSTALSFHEEQVATIASQPQKTHTPRRAKKGEDDRVVRAATITASLEAKQKSGDPRQHLMNHLLRELVQYGNKDDLMDFVPPTPHDSPLSGGHTPRSDEGRPNINELMNICTQLSNRVLALEQFKTAQDLVIKRLRKKVKRLEKKQKARTPGMKLFKIVNVASVIPDVSVAGPSTSIAGDIFKDEMSTIADILMPIRSTKPRTTSIVIHNVKEEPREQHYYQQYKAKTKFEREQIIAREKAVEQEAKNAAIEDVQARMDADVLLAERRQQEEREQFTINEQARMLVYLIAKRKRFFTAQRTEQIRNKPPTRAQLKNKMVTYLKHMGKYTHNQLKSKSFEEIQMLNEREQKWINDFVPMDFEVKLEDDDAEKEELRACLDIVLVDDIAINVESSATKYPIVDWKTHTLIENMMYYQIIKANRSSKNYKILTKMCDDFDKQDIIDLYMLVKERKRILKKRTKLEPKLDKIKSKREAWKSPKSKPSQNQKDIK